MSAPRTNQPTALRRAPLGLRLALVAIVFGVSLLFAELMLGALDRKSVV